MFDILNDAVQAVVYLEEVVELSRELLGHHAAIEISECLVTASKQELICCVDDNKVNGQ